MKLFTITIDTEADCSADWTGATPESYKNLFALSAKLLPITQKYGHRSTLLLNGDIIARAAPSQLCARMSDDFGWELGTHLHGEFVSPGETIESPAGICLRDFQCGYDPALEFAKMETITEMFKQRFGRPPTSFRAGRFGAGRATLEACCRLGYEVDTSVVPGAYLREGTAVADFRAYTNAPIIVGGPERQLVEIPVTVKPGRVRPVTPFLSQLDIAGSIDSDFLRKLPRRTAFLVDRLLAPLNRTIWLRPSLSSTAEMAQVLHWLDGLNKPVVANMMFHSNELLAGASPYNASDVAVTEFLVKVDQTLCMASKLSFQPLTLTEAARSVKKHLHVQS